MKTSFKYLLMGAAVAVSLPLFTACDDDEATDPYDLNYVYIYSPAEADNNLEYKGNGTFITSIEEECVINPVRCTKPAPDDITVNLEITPSLVESYNQEHGTSYTLLKGAKLENSSLTIKKGEYMSEQSLRVVYTDMSEFQNGTEKYILPIAISSIQGGNGLISENTSKVFLTFTSEYKANHVGFSRELYTEQLTFKPSGFTNAMEELQISQPVITEWLADSEIKVNVAIDYDKLELYNGLNGTNYQRMPVEVSLSHESLTIAQGSSFPTEAFALKFADAMAGLPLEEANYMVPLVLTAVNGEGAEMDEDAKVFYVAFNCISQPFAMETGSTAGTRIKDYSTWGITVNGSANSDYGSWSILFSGYPVDYWSTGEEMIIDFGSERNLWFIQIGTSYDAYYSYSNMKVETSVDGVEYEGDNVEVTPGLTIRIKIMEPKPIRYLRLTPTGENGYPSGLRFYVAN